MDYENSYKEALRRGERIIKSCIENDASNDVLVACVKQIFPELKEYKVEKPNGGIVSEDFNEGDGFYKVNLAYLSQEQVEEVENLVKKWNPEIKENEDDRLKKSLIDYLKERKSCESYGQYVLRYDHWIDWIEKQGEQKTTWSEDDEIMLHSIISDFKGFKHDNTSSLEPHFDNCIDWFISLKDRYTWKPTEEQIDAIRLARNTFVRNDYSGCSFLNKTLFELENQLKKIKEE